MNKLNPTIIHMKNLVLGLTCLKLIVVISLFPQAMNAQFEPTQVVFADILGTFGNWQNFEADLDNNGCDDHISASLYLHVRYCFNGELQSPISIGPVGGTTNPIPFQTSIVAILDLDNNGFKDIILHNAYILNYGYNQFGDVQFLSTIDRIEWVRDFDGDGDLDLLFGNYQNGYDPHFLMMNNGAAIFNVEDMIIPSGYVVLSEDLNADGAADIVTDAGVFFNDGIGNFPSSDPTLNGLTYYPQLYCAQDVDSDGYVDFAYFDFSNLHIVEFGTLGWTHEVEILPENFWFSKIQFVNWDQDGFYDIMLTENSNQEDFVYVSTGNSDGTYNEPFDPFYQTTQLYGADGYADDLDLDGDEDYIQYQYEDDLLVVYRNDDGIMQHHADLAGLSESFWGILLLDVNGDSLPEICTLDSLNREVIFPNIQGCDFGPSYYSDNLMTRYLAMKVENFTPDEYPDVLLLYENAIYLFENHFGDYFFEPVEIAVSDHMKTFQLKDFDLDGDIDLFYSKSDGSIWFQRNTNVNSFEPEILVFEPVGDEVTMYECDVQFGFGNFAGDSLEDVFCSRISYLGEWPNAQSFAEDFVLTNVDFDFPDDQIFLVNDSLYESPYIYHKTELTIKDFNQDGFDDVANTYYYLEVFFGNGTGNFSLEHFGEVVWDGPFSSGDIDQDSNIECLMNATSGLGLEMAEITANNELIYTGQSFLGHTGWLLDLDHDGFLDVLTSTSSPLEVYAYMNDGSGNFQNYGQFNMPGISYVAMNQVDIDLDSISDLVWLNGFGVMLARGSNETLSSLNVHVFADENENGINDNEPSLFSVPIVIEPPHQNLFTGWNGSIQLAINEGDHYIHCLPPSDLWLLSEYTADTITSTNQSSQYNIEFGLVPNGVVGEIHSFYMSPWQTCLDTVQSSIHILNAGNVRGDAVVSLTLDSHCSLINAIPNPVSVSGNIYTWLLDSLAYQTSVPIDLQLQYPGVDSIGVMLMHEIYIDEYFNDELVFSDSWLIDEQISCAYDPNDITENTGFTPAGYVNGVDFLEYTIRFQNTGNAPATTVRIECQIDESLIPNTLVPLASSHDYQLSIDQNNKIIIQYPFINLPDSTSEFELSQGFFTYRIQPLAGLSAWTEILARAEIFFDYNPAVSTNEVLNTVYSCEDLLQTNLFSGVVCESSSIECSNDATWVENVSWLFNDVFVGNGELYFDIEQSGVITMVAENDLCTVEQEFELTIDSVNTNIIQQQNMLSVGENISYQWLLNGDEILGANQQTYEVEESGYYNVIATSLHGCTEVGEPIYVLYTGISELDVIGIAIYPNPSQGAFSIQGLSGNESLKLYNAIGQIIWMQEKPSMNIVEISALTSGLYTLRIEGMTGLTITCIVVE